MLPFVCIYVSIFLCFTNVILVGGGKHTCSPSSGKAEAESPRSACIASDTLSQNKRQKVSSL